MSERQEGRCLVHKNCDVAHTVPQVLQIADLKAENARRQEEQAHILDMSHEVLDQRDAAQLELAAARRQGGNARRAIRRGRKQRDHYKARAERRGEALNGAARLLDYISRRTDDGWAGMGELKHYKTLLASINNQAREGAVLARAAIAATPDGEKHNAG